MADLLRRDCGVVVRADGAGRTIFGRAVPYSTPTEIDDGSGRYTEIFAPGAFARSIRERGEKIRLFVQHDQRRLPIGKATELREELDGLHAAFVLPATRDADDALELVRTGVVDGLSVGFVPVRDEKRSGRVVRLEASLREVSLVHSPAYADALVAGVRSTARPSLHVDIARRRLSLLLTDWK